MKHIHPSTLDGRRREKQEEDEHGVFSVFAKKKYTDATIFHMRVHVSTDSPQNRRTVGWLAICSLQGL